MAYPPDFVNSLLVEFVGTMAFLLTLLHTENILIFCTILATLIYLGVTYLGHGVHYNPAVTVMLVAAKKHPMNILIPYIIAQIAGGLTALQLYKLIH